MDGILRRGIRTLDWSRINDTEQQFQVLFPYLLAGSFEMLYSSIGVCGNAIWGTPA